MAWYEKLQEIEPLDDLCFDRVLVDELEAAARERALGPMRFYTPTFRAYASEELKGCGKASFPAFSITGAACALNCDHCQAKILEPMIAATTPDELDRKVRDLVLPQAICAGSCSRVDPTAATRFRTIASIRPSRSSSATFPICASPSIPRCSTNGAPDPWRPPGSTSRCST
ncbi:hypothetical protein ACRAVF_19425 [Bradyrhizobium oligotrophicum S58]